MTELTPREKLEQKLDKYKIQLIELKDKIEKSAGSLKDDLIIDINSIELMLGNVEKQISQIECTTSWRFNDTEEAFKYVWNDISMAIKNTSTRTLH